MKPNNPKHESNIDPLDHLPMLEALSREDTTIEPDAPVLQLTAISFARIAETAVEYHAKSLRQGTVSDFRNRARTLIESSLCEACYVSGRRDELHRLVGEKLLSPERFSELLKALAQRETEIWREAARHAASILREIQSRLQRRGKRQRPRGSGNGDALASLIDAGILRDAALRAESIKAMGKPRYSDAKKINNAMLNATLPSDLSIDEISRAIPDTVREYLRLGQLSSLGQTIPESVDRHSKRIRAQFKRLRDASPHGGSSIIRKRQ